MEQIAKIVTITISHGLEILASLLIALALITLVRDVLLSQFIRRAAISNVEARVKFGSSVAVALELLLGSDVLATAVAPSWDDIGKLVSIAIIRTALNYFLSRELKEAKV
jgi:uncharacterized membrane protein